MQNPDFFYSPRLLCVLVLTWLSVSPMLADIQRTQTLALHKGWNAVFLSVDPTNSKTAECFQGTPISMVASYVGDQTAVQFVQNPSTNTLTPANGWNVWYAPERPDAFLSQLAALSANRAYLVYAESDYAWSVTGSAVLGMVKWRPDSFTLAGFTLDDLSPPTYAQFFSGSAAHQPYRIYRLINDQWVRVANAATTQMRSGEAAWIYCNGGSDYQGPLEVKPQLGRQIYLSGSTPFGVLLANRTANPLNVTIAHPVSPLLPLAYLLQVVSVTNGVETNLVETTFDLPAAYTPPVFEAAERRGFWLILRPEAMTTDSETSLLKITSDLGTQCWLPVSGKRSAL